MPDMQKTQDQIPLQQHAMIMTNETTPDYDELVHKLNIVNGCDEGEHGNLIQEAADAITALVAENNNISELLWKAETRK